MVPVVVVQFGLCNLEITLRLAEHDGRDADAGCLFAFEITLCKFTASLGRLD